VKSKGQKFNEGPTLPHLSAAFQLTQTKAKLPESWVARSRRPHAR
jgi:hypothetical protein